MYIFSDSLPFLNWSLPTFPFVTSITLVTIQFCYSFSICTGDHSRHDPPMPVVRSMSVDSTRSSEYSQRKRCPYSVVKSILCWKPTILCHFPWPGLTQTYQLFELATTLRLTFQQQSPLFHLNIELSHFLGVSAGDKLSHFVYLRTSLFSLHSYRILLLGINFGGYFLSALWRDHSLHCFPVSVLSGEK